MITKSIIPTIQEVIKMFKFITSLLSLLQILLVGTSVPEKSTVLNKKLTNQEKRKQSKERMNQWIQLNFNFIALAAILIIVISFLLFFVWFAGVSTVESGTFYNHLGGVI